MKPRFSLPSKLIIFSLFLFASSNISAANSHTLSGTIYGGNEPLPSAVVSLSDSETGLAIGSLNSDSYGKYQFEVEVGSYDLEVTAPDDSGFGTALIQSIEVIDEDVVQDVILIEHGFSLSGIVRLPDGTPVPSLEMRFVGAGSREIIEKAFTDSSGRYQATLPGGSYSVYSTLELAGTSQPEFIGMFWRHQTLTSFELKSNDTLDIELPFVNVSGTVVDAAGEPVPGAQIGIAEDNYSLQHYELFRGLSVSNSGYRVTADSSGRFDFWIPSHDNYTVLLYPPVGSEYSLTSLKNSDFSVDHVATWALKPGHELRGSVNLSNGDRVSSVRLKFYLAGTETEIAQASSDASGEFALFLPANSYRVSAFVKLSGKGSPGYSWEDSNLVKSLEVTDDTHTEILLPFVRVTGSTVNAAGDLVPNVEIGLSGEHSLSSGGYLRGLAESGGPYRIRSDGSGAFDFWIPAHDDYIVMLIPPSDTGLGTSMLSGTDLSADINRDFVLESAPNLNGIVKLPDGTPLPNVSISFWEVGSGAKISTVNTGVDGGFSLPMIEGEIRIGARIDVLNRGDGLFIGDFWRDDSLVDNHVTNENQLLEIILPFSKINGVTTDSNGVPVAGVGLGIAGEMWIDYPWELYRSDAAKGSQYRTESDELGTFTFWAPEHSNYTVLVIPPEDSGFALNSTPNMDFNSDRYLAIILPFMDVEAPLVISGPYVTSITDTTAVVEWQTDEPASSAVHYGVGQPSGGSEHLDGYRTLHSVLLTGLTPATTYQVQVESSDDDGNGPTLSDVVDFTTLSHSDTTAPFIIEGPMISSITHDSAVVEWVTSEAATTELSYGLGKLDQDAGEDGYRVHHSVVLTGLSADSHYSVQVYATDEAGNGPTESAVVKFWTLIQPDIDAPLIISGPMVIDITDTEATVIWETNEPATSGVSYNDGTAYGVVRDDALVTQHSVRLTNLMPGTLYYYTVSSTDGEGNGPTLSAEKVFKTLQSGDHRPPVITMAPRVIGLTHHSAVIFWKTDEPASTQVEYGTSPEALDYLAGKAKLKTTHTLQLTDLYSGTEYFFRVRSRDAAGNEVVSDIDSFTTRDTMQPTMASFVIAPEVIQSTDTEVTLSWETDEPTDYVVEYGADASIQRRSSGQKARQHQVTLSGLESSEAYAFNVVATNTEGEVTAEFGEFATGLHDDIEAPRFLDDPKIVIRRGDYAVVVWSTDEVANAAVQYGPAGRQLNRVTGELRFVKNHVQVLTNLEPNTEYAVRVTSADIAGNEGSAGQEVTFHSGNQNDVVPPVLQEPPLVYVDGTNAWITWEIDEYASVMIAYGTSPDDLRYIRSVEGLSFSDLLELNGLEAGQTYYFKLIATDPAGNRLESEVLSFETEGGDPDQCEASAIEVRGHVYPAGGIQTKVCSHRAIQASDVVVPVGADVLYSAPAVQLKPGFRVEQGGSFQVSAQP